MTHRGTTNKTHKVAFITGASRGIGAEAAVALARSGYKVAITARTLSEGETHHYVGQETSLPGSLEATARAVADAGSEALCLPADILQPDAMVGAARAALAHFGRVDLLFNNAVFQGTGNQERLLQVNQQQLENIYRANVFTPLALVQTLLPTMLQNKCGTLLNMVSATAFTDPPAPADEGGWGFAYPSSKAALARMVGALRVEHPGAGIRAYSVEPGLVVTEVMRLAGIDEGVLARFKPCSPAAIGAVIAWLADNDPDREWQSGQALPCPAIAKALGLLQTPSFLEDPA